MLLRTRSILVMVLCLLALPARGGEEDAPAHEGAATEHEEHHRFHVGVNGTVLGPLTGPTAAHPGGGLFFTVSAIPGWLEVEFVVHALVGDKGAVDVPIDILLKKPFHVNRWFHPFIGLGPTLSVAIEAEQNALYVGGASALGADFWLTRHLALVAELNFNLLYRTAVFGGQGGADTAGPVAAEQPALVPELGGAMGALIGF